MQKYAKIDNGVVDNIIFSKKEGYIKVPNNVFGGMIQQEDGTFTTPPKSEEETQTIFRAKRDSLLAEIDSYQGVLRWNDLTNSQQLEITDYRKDLLNSTSDWIMPDKPSWI